jgi:hypothetical protein
MLQTVEAMVDETGNVRLLEPLHLSSLHRALVTILDGTRGIASAETALSAKPRLPPTGIAPRRTRRGLTCRGHVVLVRFAAAAFRLSNPCCWMYGHIVLRWALPAADCQSAPQL